MAIPIKPAEIITQSTHRIPGRLLVTESFFRVPLDHASPDGPTIEVFARSVRRHTVPVDSDSDSAGSSSDGPEAKSKKAQQPYLVYLTGGPGFECRSPQSYPWTNDFLDKGYQMLYLDQRGTGFSSAINTRNLNSACGSNTDAQVDYLKHFRADNIVRDCEAIRLALTADWPSRKQKWSVLGSSFGGFCCTTYLSFYPQGLKEVFIAGGLPPIFETSPDRVYERLFKRVEARNRAYYDKYPGDRFRVRAVLHAIMHRNVETPSGADLTAERFMALGWYLGFHGGIDTIHDLVLRADIDNIRSIDRSELEGGDFPFTRQLLDSLDRALLPLDNNPIYTILHEPIYCQGKASNWAADRIKRSLPQFDNSWLKNARLHLSREGETEEDKGLPTALFTGEMVFPWMLGISTEMEGLRDVAEQLAWVDDWPALYDVDQLRRNEVPVYAAVFVDDMYVDYELSLQTAEAIRRCKTVVTNMAYHDGIRAREAEIVGKLWELRCDSLD